jgi:hypothetical protein
MKTLLLAGTAVLLAALSTSCGSSGGTCGNAAPCGGDVVATWTIASSCVSDTAKSMGNMNCPGATTNTSSLHIGGTATFNADMTYTRTTTTSGTVTTTFPASCLSQGGVTITCAELSQLLMQDPSMGSGSCAGTTSCSCTFNAQNASSTETGTYTTTAAGVLTLTSSTNGVEEDDYCVKGNTFTISPHPGAASSMGVSGTITFTKS